MGEDQNWMFNQDLLNNQNLFGNQSFDGSNTSNTGGYAGGQTTGNASVFNSNAVNNSLAGDNNSLFGNMDASTAFQGLGVGANIFFGKQNLDMAKKNLSMKKEQHKAYMEDRAANKARDARLAAIRF